MRRLTSKGYVIATFLAPVLLLAVIGVAVVVGVLTQGADGRRVAVVDPGGAFAVPLLSALPEGWRGTIATVPEDSLQARIRSGDLDAYLVLPPELAEGRGVARYVSAGGGGLSTSLRLERAVSEAVRAVRLEQLGTPDTVRAVLDWSPPIRRTALTDEGEQADSSVVQATLGYVLGFIVYLAIFIYGAVVLRGVIEEKQNRIVEVIASSARPFELLMGKVLGIGAVGLVQMVVWAALILAAMAVAGPLLAAALDPAALGVPEGSGEAAVLEAAGVGALAPPPLSLLAAFVGFFLGGYLLYAGLFAAVGSAVESEADAQSLQAPIMIPVILPSLLLPFVTDAPDAPLSIGLSLFPFFSPILMPVRMASTAVPAWEVAAALGLLVVAFLGTIWVAARIYRVGILMYGKKASLADLWRWARHA